MYRLRRFALFIFIIAVLVFASFTGYRKMTSDHTGPEISVPKKELVLSVEDGEDALLKGVRANDARDGNVSDSLMVESVSNFTSDQKRVVTYAAVDSSHNVSRATRVISYKDYKGPKFVVKNAPRFSVSELDSASDYSRYIQASDVLDGDVTKNIKVLSVEDYAENSYGGSRNVLFQVSNSAGDVANLPLTVSYTEPNSPYVNLSSYAVYIKKGGSINPGDYMASVEMGTKKYSVAEFQSEMNGSIEIRNRVNAQEAGTYTVEFVAVSENERSAVTYMTVIVQ